MKLHTTLVLLFLAIALQSQSPSRSADDFPGMVLVQGGTFQMGSEDGEGNEKPIHSVTVSDFYLHKNELTNEEFVKFLNAASPSVSGEDVKLNGNLIYDLACTIGCDNWSDRIIYSDGQFSVKSGYHKHPVVNVTWYGAIEYCNWLSEKDKFQKVYSITGRDVSVNWSANGFRLPTEAEWEFAAGSRGKNEKWAGTSSESSLTAYGNFCDENCTKSWKNETLNDGFVFTAPIGSFWANDLGLFDMSGNVYEWCWDWMDRDYYSKSSSPDPRGPDSGIYRVLRGGSWLDEPASLRCANRLDGALEGRNVNVGFRLARPAR